MTLTLCPMSNGVGIRLGCNPCALEILLDTSREGTVTEKLYLRKSYPPPAPLSVLEP